MKTVALLIGNSDDKLGQADWASFMTKINAKITDFANDVYFTGASMPYAPWQNACWVFSIDEQTIPRLKTAISKTRDEFKQRSVAWVEGETHSI